MPFVMQKIDFGKCEWYSQQKEKGMDMERKPQFILGSGSPRRKDVLERLGCRFLQEVSEFDESLIPLSLPPKEYVTLMAAKKGEEIIKKTEYGHLPILTTDTTVHFQGKILNKPLSKEEAFTNLYEMRGNSHEVITGISVRHGNEVYSEAASSTVYFTSFTENELSRFLEKYPPFSYAGGYAIQNGGSFLVEKIEGCFFNVVGLPINLVRKLLRKVHVDIWPA